MADKVGAFDHLECSAKGNVGVQEVFQAAMKAVNAKEGMLALKEGAETGTD